MKIIDFRILTISDMVLLSSLLLVFLIQIYYLLRYYLKLARHKDSLATQNPNHISIILSVRNEEQHIREILDKFKEQQFEDYQILVINVHSEDNTDGVLNALTETNPRLKVTSLSQESQFNEKQIINIGLKGASSPWIIFLTSASGDIKANWLADMNGLIAPETDLVVAYTNVERLKGFRNLICRLERFNQFVISGAWTLAGKPFVFNEDNVLFKKSMYFDTLGFRHKMNRNFANLELIFNENLRKNRIKVSTNPDLAVREHIEDDRGDHIRLLKKGVQIRQSLSWAKKISLFFDDFTRIVLPLLTAAIIIIHPEYWIIILALPLIYLILQAIIVKMLINRLNERKIFLSSLVYILIKPIINWWFFWSMYVIHRRSRWN
ncbi:MAG: glycosyltransferase [Prolixibacteraceae bacterium]|nr:glycosyltransferase [Prolixibacteraceae bacterium]